MLQSPITSLPRAVETWCCHRRLRLQRTAIELLTVRRRGREGKKYQSDALRSFHTRAGVRLAEQSFWVGAAQEERNEGIEVDGRERYRHTVVQCSNETSFNHQPDNDLAALPHVQYGHLQLLVSSTYGHPSFQWGD